MINVGINSNNDSFKGYNDMDTIERELDRMHRNYIKANKPSLLRANELCKKLELIEKSLNRVGMSAETILPDDDEIAIMLENRMNKAFKGRTNALELSEEELQEVVEVLSATIGILGLRVGGSLSFFS